MYCACLLRVGREESATAGDARNQGFFVPLVEGNSQAAHPLYRDVIVSPGHSGQRRAHRCESAFRSSVEDVIR